MRAAFAKNRRGAYSLLRFESTAHPLRSAFVSSTLSAESLRRQGERVERPTSDQKADLDVARIPQRWAKSHIPISWHDSSGLGRSTIRCFTSDAEISKEHSDSPASNCRRRLTCSVPTIRKPLQEIYLHLYFLYGPTSDVLNPANTPPIGVPPVLPVRIVVPLDGATIVLYSMAVLAFDPLAPVVSLLLGIVKPPAASAVHEV